MQRARADPGGTKACLTFSQFKDNEGKKHLAVGPQSKVFYFSTAVMQDLGQSHFILCFSFESFASISVQVWIHLRGKDFCVVWPPSFRHWVHYPPSTQDHHHSFLPHTTGCITYSQADAEVCDLPEIWKLYECPAVVLCCL